MQKLIFLIAAVLLASGCQTISGSGTSGVSSTADISIVKGSQSHLIEVEVDENLRSMLNSIFFYNITESNKRYVLVSGSIKKQMGGASIDRKKINVRLVDDKGKILAEGLDRISVVRLRRPVGSRGRFSIKMPYIPDIKKCIVSIEVK